ncbi:hypothetical protein LINPERPRIM_LOCUS38880 [Linum perenne]
MMVSAGFLVKLVSQLISLLEMG